MHRCAGQELSQQIDVSKMGQQPELILHLEPSLVVASSTGVSSAGIQFKSWLRPDCAALKGEDL